MKKKQSVATVDVLSHSLVPEMKVLSESEKSKVLSKYGVNDRQLPRILSSDQEAMALKAAPGDVIKIERDDGTGKYTTYRVVVES
ncbi:MAG: DNA-directed RNA polymerase subunit RpoH/Rpb5 C-terminal domain-containing protein [Candidatus Micrarchaeia archaeon]